MRGEQRWEILAEPQASQLGLPMPMLRSGAFWWAGNPAALRTEMEPSRSEYAVGETSLQGDYRRPLDPPESASRWATVLGWLPSGDHSALLGRAYASRERHSPGSGANSVNPYTTSPFVTLDTMRSDIVQTRIWLDGAASAAFGKWAIGIGLGLETREHQSVASPLVRRTRQSMPGISLGFTRELGGLRLGSYARWRSRSETNSIIERAAQGLVVQLEGLQETQPLSINESYRRRTREDIPTAGVSITRVSTTSEWTVYAEGTSLRERLTRQESNDPVWDRWYASAFNSGFAWSSRTARGRQLAVAVSYANLRGNGDLGLDTSGVVHRATKNDVVIAAEWRPPSDSLGWQAAFSASSVVSHNVQTAPSIPISSTVLAATHSVRADVGRVLTRQLHGSAGILGSRYFARSSFPGPLAFGETYSTYVLPELDMASRSAQVWAIGASLRWVMDAETSMWLRAGFATLSPTESGITAFGPAGSRRRFEMLMGLTLQGIARQK
jgi:hypothetical protein